MQNNDKPYHINENMV